MMKITIDESKGLRCVRCGIKKKDRETGDECYPGYRAHFKRHSYKNKLD